MAGKAQYTDEQKDELIELAQLKGIAPAIRELGYPSYTGAVKWFKERELDVPMVDSLMQKAADMRVSYDDNAKKAPLQIAIDRIVEMIHEDARLTADDINKLSNALAKLLQTYQLIEGKNTSIIKKEETDYVNESVKDLVDKMRVQNEEKAKLLG